jgi:hypothetical protein
MDPMVVSTYCGNDTGFALQLVYEPLWPAGRPDLPYQVRVRQAEQGPWDVLYYAISAPIARDAMRQYVAERSRSHKCSAS